MTILDKQACSAAGLVSSGGICSHTNEDATYALSFGELIDFLEAQPARDCVVIPGTKICAENQNGIKTHLAARGAAICMSSDDWGRLKTELELACRELGASCSYQTKQAISKMP